MRAGADRGGAVVSPSRYARNPLSREGLQLGFAAVDAARIRRGVRELAVAFEGLVPGVPRRPHPSRMDTRTPPG